MHLKVTVSVDVVLDGFEVRLGYRYDGCLARIGDVFHGRIFTVVGSGSDVLSFDVGTLWIGSISAIIAGPLMGL